MHLVSLTPKTSELGYMFRYEDCSGSLEYMCLRFPIRKETECGYWIEVDWQERWRWVAKEGRNNYAKITKQAALTNYYYRKRRQGKILEARLQRVRYLEAKASIELGIADLRPRLPEGLFT